MRRQGLKIKIVVDGRFCRFIKALKYLIAAIGLFSSYIITGSPHLSFIFSLGLFAFSALVEKVIFTYSNMYIHNLPDFKIENEKWTGMSFGVAREPGGNPEMDIPLVGMIMEDKEYAQKIDRLLMSWCYNKPNDTENNISSSVVLDGTKRYTFFIYPNTEKPNAINFFSEAENEPKEDDKSLEPRRLHVMLVLGKGCEVSQNSYFPTFIKRYRKGVPYILSLVVQNGSDSVNVVEGTNKYFLYDLKNKDREKLTRKDIEYDMLRIFS